MRFDSILVRGRLQRRYKRFLCDVEIAPGRVVTAHCANPGSMLGLASPGREVFLSRTTDKKRKLAYGLELVRAGKSASSALVGVNTILANRIVAEALEKKAIAELRAYPHHRREVKMGKSSRVDFLLERPGAPECYVEVKSVTLSRRNGLLEFPDSPTARGAKHLDELGRLAARGKRAVMLFLAQRGDGKALAIAQDIDPAYQKALKAALAQGVEILCYSCKVTRRGITLCRRLPFKAP